MAKLTRAEVLRLLGGDVNAVGAELAQFSSSSTVLSSDRPRLIDTHNEEWVAVYHGKVVAVAHEYDDLLTRLEETGAPAGQAIVRYIDRSEKTFIL